MKAIIVSVLGILAFIPACDNHKPERASAEELLEAMAATPPTPEDSKSLAERCVTRSQNYAMASLRVKQLRDKLDDETVTGKALLLAQDLKEATDTETKYRDEKYESETALRTSFTDESASYMSAIKRYDDALEKAATEHLRDVTDGDWQSRQKEWHRVVYMKFPDVIQEFGGE